jgi:F-type H+-transporting ATPase subunit b
MEFLSNPETWVAAAFIIFVALAAKPIGRAIGRGLDARADRIRAQLDEARSLRDEAERLLAEQQRKQIAAVKESEAIIAHAREEAERIHRESAANLEAAFGRREKMALDKIAQAEAQAVTDVRNQAVAVAIAAAAKLLANNIDTAKADALVDDSIRELERKLH